MLSVNRTCRLETENRQLHQVIAQLRQVRKSNRGEEENLLRERDELRTQCAAQQADIARLEKQLSSNTASSEQVVRLRAELSGALNKTAYLEQTLEDVKRQLGSLESAVYHKEAQLDVATADLQLLRQDLDQRGAEVRNLMEALSQIQAEKTAEVARCWRELEDRMAQFRIECDEQLASAASEWTDKLRIAEQRRLQAEQQSEDERLFRRKAELDFNQEKRRVQSTLEGALQQLSTSQADVVDRTLIANLLVSYFRRRR